MIFLRTTLAFLSLLILTRLLGKKQMSQMTFFNYVTGITIGSLAADIISTSESSIFDKMLSLILWCALTACLAYITLKFEKLKVVIDGQPVILIRKGILEKDSMKKTRISLEDLSIMLREKNIFSVLEVDYAILEPNGKLSVLQKQAYLNPSKADMDIPILQTKYLPSQIIRNSHLVYENLKELNLSIEWLNTQLKLQNINNIDEVFYAEIQNDGSLYIVKN